MLPKTFIGLVKFFQKTNEGHTRSSWESDSEEFGFSTIDDRITYNIAFESGVLSAARRIADEMKKVEPSPLTPEENIDDKFFEKRSDILNHKEVEACKKG